MSPDAWQNLEPDLRTWLAALAKRRAAGETIAETTAERLAAAMVDDAPDALDHATVEDQLPAYVEAELRGVAVAQAFPDVNRHLRRCDECFELYTDLLQIELGELPAPLPLPQASYLDRLRSYVLQGTEVILSALHRDRLRDLPLVAEVFFSTWQGQFDRLLLQPQPQTAFNFSSDTPVALRFLAATLVTTGRLGQTLSETQVTSLQAAGQLESVVRREAHRVASDLGFRREAGLFAEQYTRWMMTQISHLPREGQPDG